METIIKKIRIVAKLVRFILGNSGKKYGIGIFPKLALARQIIKINGVIKSLSTWQQQLVLVEDIFNTPISLQGDVVECGCYNGASTASLSLACKLTNRKLFVCDSFEGLSKPTEEEEFEVSSIRKNYIFYKKGDYSSEGGLQGVKNNVERYGSIEVCNFVKGFFADSLPHMEIESIIMIFEDADLPSAVEDCLQHLWPKLRDGCKFYCHEPWSIQVVSIFYNEAWWLHNLDTHPPGFYGSGRGEVLGMGYAKKFSAEQIIREGSELELNFTKEKDIWKGQLSPKKES